MAARLPRFDTILIILINVISLSPMLACGYTGDDAINSMMPGMLAERNTTSLAFVAEQIHKWATAYGRFYPLAFYYIPFFAHVQSLLAYRVLGMLIVLSNVYLFGRLLSRWTGSPRLGKLAAIFLPLLFQFRPYPDPIHSFCFLLQVTFMFLVAALLWLDGFLETGRRRQLVLGTAAYLCAVLTYEVAWPFFALALVAACLRAPARLCSSRPRLVLWSFGGAAVFFLMLSVALRLAFHVPLVQRHPMDGASKYTPTLQAMAYVDALVKQTASALPLSYRLLSVDDFRGTDASIPVALLVSLVLAYSITLPRLLRNPPSSLADSSAIALKPLGSRSLVIVGLLWMVLPGALIALSPAHGQGLKWGVGYLPVYLAYYGVALLLVAAATGLISGLEGFSQGVRRLRVPALYGITASCALFGAINLNTNAVVIQNGNHGCRYSREVLQHALEHGLVRDAPAGAYVYAASAHVWDRAAYASDFFRTYAGRHVTVMAKGEYKGVSVEPAYVLRYEASRRGGYALFGRIKQMQVKRDEMLEATGDAVVIYVQDADANFAVSGRSFPGGDSTGSQFVYLLNRMTILGKGSNWVLCRLPSEGSAIDLLSLEIHLR